MCPVRVAGAPVVGIDVGDAMSDCLVHIGWLSLGWLTPLLGGTPRAGPHGAVEGGGVCRGGRGAPLAPRGFVLLLDAALQTRRPTLRGGGGEARQRALKILPGDTSTPLGSEVGMLPLWGPESRGGRLHVTLLVSWPVSSRVAKAALGLISLLDVIVPAARRRLNALTRLRLFRTLLIELLWVLICLGNLEGSAIPIPGGQRRVGRGQARRRKRLQEPPYHIRITQ